MRDCSFITAGRDAERRLVALLAEVDRDVADRVWLRLALGLTVAEVEAARIADVGRIGGAAFLTIRTVASDRVPVLPLGPLYDAVVRPRERGAQGDRLFPPEDAAATVRAFTHGAVAFPGISEEAITDHYAHRTGAPKSSHARRAEAFMAKGRLPPGMGWF